MLDLVQLRKAGEDGNGVQIGCLDVGDEAVFILTTG